MIPVSISNLSLSSMGFVVLLKSRVDDRSLPIFVGVPEAQSLALVINRTAVPRPMTHDLMKNLLDILECRLESVHVTDLKDGTFYGTLNVAAEGREFSIDARPSDAISLALRCNAPVFVAEGVMDSAGVVMKEEDQEKEKVASPEATTPVAKHASPPGKPQDPIDMLKASLDTAIREERYEDAARLRDDIRRAEAIRSEFQA